MHDKIPRSVRDELARLGVPLASATINGRPLSEAIAETDKAKSRAVTGRYRSKTEQLYSWLLEDQLRAGDITQWEYEPFRVSIGRAEKGKGRGAWFTPDFAVWIAATGAMEFREIKGGFVREAARVRFLVAKRLYPACSWRMIQRTKDGAWVDIL